MSTTEQRPSPYDRQAPSYNVTVRISVRRIADGRTVGREAVGTFDMREAVPAERMGEVALDAARALAEGLSVHIALTRARAAVRDFARRPEVQRSAAVIASALRQSATVLEHSAAAAAARLVTRAPPPEDGE